MTPLIISCPIVTFFLLTISALAALDSVLTEHKRVLLPPTNLSVVFDDYNSVVVYWNYTEPEHVQTSEIIFIGSIVSEKNETSQHVLSSSRKPHHDQWRNLRPRTKYTLNLCAAHPKWERSPAIRSSFITLVDDYPTPLIKDVTPRNWRQALDYSVEWELWPESEHLLYFDIILCTDDCTFTRVPSYDFEATVPINFYTRFSLSVMAYYDAPMIGIVRRESPASPGFSEVGAPSEVRCITKFAQLGNILEIEWEPPVPSNGPVNYYETFVFDPLNPLSYSWKNVTTEPKVTLMAPLIRGSLYTTRIRAVNIDSKGVHHRGDFAFFDNERAIPPSEVFVEVLRRGPHRVHFKLIPALGQSNILFYLESQVKLSRAGLEFNEAEAFNLTPNQRFSVSVQTCYVTKDVSTHTCGGYFHIKLKSNVDRPSEVQDLLAVITNKPTVAFVTWKVPESPNGPINAYIIHALSNKPGYPVPHLEKYRTNDTWLRFEKTLAQKLLDIRVAAVNLDVDDDSIELIGTWTSAPRPYPKEYHESDHLNLLVILVFVTAFASTIIVLVDSDFRTGEIILRYIRRLRRRRIRRVDLLDGVPDQQRAPAPEAGLDLIADIH